MWIKECRGLYEEFVERIAGKPTDPGRLENALSEANAARQVGPRELQIIEESPHWPYPTWWPKLSNQLGDPITLPENCSSLKGKQKAVEDLQEQLKHIEVVSIVLRFLLPEEFGIISPPVIGLLNLVPGKEDFGKVRGTSSTPRQAPSYLHYLSVLDKLRQRYGVFERIADFDMALWTAAHLHHWTEYTALLDEMNHDRDFQEIRLENLMEGLGREWEGTERARLTLAKVLLKPDHVLAALIAARCFESKVVEMAEQRGITASMRYIGESELHSLVRKLERQSGAVPAGISLDELRRYRNTAVHDFEPPISKDNARKLVTGVKHLWGR